ncbi:hypothetical protein [Nonomuraea typhae]|uniref:DUF3558 domain-containing protein n=1 Tax=Nonomuraea typhae TaxID=2603600 RepID=A0ABW7YYH0_9ACTN
MRAAVLASLVASLVMTACTSSPPVPRDRTPLGSVVESPGECGVLSRTAISRATGLAEFSSSGTETLAHFAYCLIRNPADSGAPLRLAIELDDPMRSTVDGVERKKATDKGVSLPAEVGPGYSAIIRDQGGEPAGAYVTAWTPDGARLLSIELYRGAPGRDHRADVVEFAKQLRPVLLDKR